MPHACPRLFAILRPRGPELITPPAPAPAPALQTVRDTGGALHSLRPIPSDFAACEPLRDATGLPSRYAAESFFHIGDVHFESARDDGGNARAIAAYLAAMRWDARRTTAEHGWLWQRALYKIGWSYYRMEFGYPEALRNFSSLLDHVGVVDVGGSRAVARSDVLRWLGVIFAESYWGESFMEAQSRCQAVVEALARPPAEAPRPFDCEGIARIVSPLDLEVLAGVREPGPTLASGQDPRRPTFIPQDRPWTPEAWIELTDLYFEATKYYEAITLASLFLRRYPLNPRAPHAAEIIATAYARQRQFELSERATEDLTRYTAGTPWWTANTDHSVRRRAAETCRNALRYVARSSYEAAMSPRETTGGRADALYGTAARFATLFIDSFPADEAARELRVVRAESLFGAGRYDEAARAFSEVGGARAAYRAVEALERRVRALVPDGDRCFAFRAGLPPDALGGEMTALCANPSAATEVPEAVRALIIARSEYASRVVAHAEGEGADRARFLYLNARTLRLHGLFADAEARYRELLRPEGSNRAVQCRVLEDLVVLYALQRRAVDQAAAASQHTWLGCSHAPPSTQQDEESEGSVDLNYAARIVRNQLGAFRGCYEGARRRHPALAGSLELRFTIGTSGRVTSVTTEGLASAPELGSCVVSSVRDLVFPRPEGGDANLSIPFYFGPDG